VDAHEKAATVRGLLESTTDENAKLIRLEPLAISIQPIPYNQTLDISATLK